MRKCEETQVVCIKEESRDWISRLVSRHTCEACRELKVHDSWSTTGQKVQFGLEVISRLKLATHSSCEAKLP